MVRLAPQANTIKFPNKYCPLTRNTHVRHPAPQNVRAETLHWPSRRSGVHLRNANCTITFIHFGSSSRDRGDDANLSSDTSVIEACTCSSFACYALQNDMMQAICLLSKIRMAHLFASAGHVKASRPRASIFFKMTALASWHFQGCVTYSAQT